MAAAGIALGVLIAVPAMQLLRALLYQVTPGDPWVFVLLAAVLLAVTLLAGYIPARRATRVDPLVTLASGIGCGSLVRSVAGPLVRGPLSG